MYFSYQLNKTQEAQLQSLGISANRIFRDRNSELYVPGHSPGAVGQLSGVFVSYALSQNPQFDGEDVPAGNKTVLIEWNDGSREISQLMLWSSVNGFTADPKGRGKALRWLLKWGILNHPNPIIKAGLQNVRFAVF